MKLRNINIMLHQLSYFCTILRVAVGRNMRYFGNNSQVKCKRLEKKVAIVTASTNGIGYSIAKRLAQEGAKVMICSRKESNVKKAVDELLQEGLSVAGTVCHVGKSEERKKLFDETISVFGGLDILVSNAAVNPQVGPVLESEEEVWDKIFDINVKCTYLLMKESLPLLKKSKLPSIIIISSITGYQPFNLFGVYSVSKTALLGLCKAAAENLSTYGIRVNCIAPGIIETKFSEPLHKSESIKAATIEKIPLGRIGKPDEIGGIAAFLASNDASYITGETIIASGGMQSRL
ncbi:dehydrogenase/reductase SDR family member 4-like [Vespa mandarinia]|uniref:dehydrogenase/reductase SDR family member 4-like n=1 Tax=Vespa mandarinia TaxID=7446 RepID=UPI00161FE9AB|nr:dehydrogenase/reductase SDR family member 4-like [Vespa mandarinia]